MLKKFFGLLALIVSLNFSVANAALESVTDKAGVLKPTEIELLNQKIRNVEQAHKIKIGVAFVKTVGGRDMITASNDLLDQNFANGINTVKLTESRDKFLFMNVKRRPKGGGRRGGGGHGGGGHGGGGGSF